MSTIIPFSEIVIHPASSGIHGFVFVYNEEFYRAVPEDRKAMIDVVCKIDNISMVKMKETDYKLQNYEKFFIYKKDRVYRYITPVNVSVPYRIADFIEVICRINIELIKCGYILWDVHESNILDTPDGPVFFDIDSPEYLNSETAVHSMAKTLYLANMYMYGKCSATDHKKYSWRMAQNEKTPVSKIAYMDPTNIISWEELIKTVHECPGAIPNYTHWANEYAITVNSDNINLAVGPKETGALRLINSINYDHVLDLGCNKGYYTLYAAKKAKESMGVDIDRGCITTAIKEAKKHNSNTLFSTLSINQIDFIFRNYGFAVLNKLKYLNSDLVLALAIVHHINIPQVNFANIICNIANKYIIIEDIQTSAIYQNIFAKKFKLLDRIVSYPSDRTISLYGVK